MFYDLKTSKFLITNYWGFCDSFLYLFLFLFSQLIRVFSEFCFCF